MKPEETEQSMLDKLRECYEDVLKTKARLGLRLTPIESLKLRRLRAMSKDTDLRSVFQPFFDGLDGCIDELNQDKGKIKHINIPVNPKTNTHWVKEYIDSVINENYTAPILSDFVGKIEKCRKEFNQIKSQNMKTEKEFAVKSDSFALYEAFKKECEGIGWKYGVGIMVSPFDSISVNFHKHLRFDAKTSPIFTLSNFETDVSFNLGSQFSEALAYAKRVFEESKKKKVTYEDVAKELFKDKSSNAPRFYIASNGVVSPVFNTQSNYSPNEATNECQLEKLLAINKLMNVAAYLNPKGEKATYAIYLNPDSAIHILPQALNYGQARFVSRESAQQSIEILGEGVVRLALS